MNANGRRARQLANGYRHLAKRGRPILKTPVVGLKPINKGKK